MNYKEKLQKAAFKEAFIYPKLEDIQTNLPYALTISPLYIKESYFESYIDLEDDIAPLLKGRIQLRPELSTQTQRWHWHGTLEFLHYLDIVYFYMNLPKLKAICTFTIKNIDKSYEWYLYCIKQRHILKPYICFLYHSHGTKQFNLVPYCYRSDDQKIIKKKPNIKVITIKQSHKVGRGNLDA